MRFVEEEEDLTTALHFISGAIRNALLAVTQLTS